MGRIDLSRVAWAWLLWEIGPKAHSATYIPNLQYSKLRSGARSDENMAEYMLPFPSFGNLRSCRNSQSQGQLL
jgi:hypothetical protein